MIIWLDLKCYRPRFNSFFYFLFTGGMVERRLLLTPVTSLTIGSMQYGVEKGAVKIEFTDSEFSIDIPPFEN